MFQFIVNKLLFYPVKYPDGEWDDANDLPVEDVWFESEDKTALHGWYIPHPDSRGTVLFCHGNWGNISHRLQSIRNIYQLGMNVFIFDYRGYGRSKGKPSERAVYMDGRAARAWLIEQKGVAAADIVILGKSMGGGVAVELASTFGARALVLECTFTSLVDVALSTYPYLPVRFIMNSQMDSVNKIHKYRGPVLQVHGTADEVVPYRLGEALFKAANGPKKFIGIEGGDHRQTHTAEYLTALSDLFN